MGKKLGRGFEVPVSIGKILGLSLGILDPSSTIKCG